MHFLRGQKGKILYLIFQRNKASQRTQGPEILLSCCNSLLWGSEQFHFLPELSTMNSNNSALCFPDSLVKPIEQNVTNTIPGRRGVAHRLKLTTSPKVANLHLSQAKNSEAKPNPWAKLIMLGKKRGENKYLRSTATISHSLSLLLSLTETVVIAIPLPREANLFWMQNSFFLSLFLSLRPALSSLRKQGLRVYTCDPNFPFCVRF